MILECCFTEIIEVEWEKSAWCNFRYFLLNMEINKHGLLTSI